MATRQAVDGDQQNTTIRTTKSTEDLSNFGECAIVNPDGEKSCH